MAGSVYKRGDVWWLSFYFRGKQIRTSSKSPRKRDAEKLLSVYLGEIAQGRFSGLKTDKDTVTVGELLDDFLEDCIHRGLKDIPHVICRGNVLKEQLGTMDAGNLTERTVDLYIKHRLKQGRRKSTINRETQHLKQALKLAQRKKLITTIPYMQRFREDNARQGFFEDHEFESVLNALPCYLKDFTAFAYYSGWRKGEIAGLEWRDVQGDVIRLRPERSKTRTGRVLPLVGELADIIERRKAERYDLVPLVFHYGGGKPIQDIRDSWRNACRAAGCEGKLFHDFRRTAVRNMIRAGVPEKVAMAISGHRSRTIFDRYHIVNEADIEHGLTLMQEHLKATRATSLFSPKQARSVHT